MSGDDLGATLDRRTVQANHGDDNAAMTRCHFARALSMQSDKSQATPKNLHVLSNRAYPW
jgi:hypothetical protein